MQGAQQDVRDHLGVRVRPLGRDERADVAVPEAVDRMVAPVAVLRRPLAGGSAPARGGRLRRAAEGELRQEALVAGDDLDDRIKEGEQALPVGCSRAQRWRPAGHRLGQRLGALDHERRHQPHPAAEPVEDRALADPGRQRDLPDRDVLRPVRRQEFFGGRQDHAPVARRVGALGPGLAHRDLLRWTTGPAVQ
jgi:hypothetical protein